MKVSKKAWPFVAAVQIVVCLALAAVAGTAPKNSQTAELSAADWQSHYLTYDQGWYADESIVQTEETVDLLYGPYLALKRGTYYVKIDYTCDSDQSCLVSASHVSDEILKTGPARLSKNQTSASWRFTLADDVSNLEVLVKYNGQGSFRIQNITIAPHRAGVRRLLVMVLCLFVLLDLYVYFKILWRPIIISSGGFKNHRISGNSRL